MASIISAGTTSGTSLNLSGDTSGVLQLASNGSTTAVTIDTSQNVGIGTSSPTTKLHVVGRLNVVGSIGTISTDSQGLTLDLNRAGTTGITNNNASGVLTLGTATNEVMRITSAGQVGIGTSSPGHVLDVKAAQGTMGVTSTTGTNISYVFASNTGDAFLMGKDNSVGGLTGSAYANFLYNGAAYPMLFLTNGTERFRIASSGETTFTGNTTFSAANFAGKLGSASGYGYWSNSDVSSFIQINGLSNAVPYRVYVTAQSNGVYMAANATSWTANSDARLKNITGTFTNALADVLQIEAVKFTWKSDAENRPCVGLIAQSVEKVLPEAVSKGALNNSEDKTEYLGVQYTEVIPLLVAAIQELKAELDATKAEVQALKGVA